MPAKAPLWFHHVVRRVKTLQEAYPRCSPTPHAEIETEKAKILAYARSFLRAAPYMETHTLATRSPKEARHVRPVEVPTVHPSQSTRTLIRIR